MIEVTRTDPISELAEKFRESLVERGMARYKADSVTELYEDNWRVDGLDKFDDAHPAYEVELQSDGTYHCSCYEHRWGGSRENSVCSHVMAVMIYRRMARIEEQLAQNDDTDYLSELIDSVWPHPDYRANQKEVIRDALETLYGEDQEYYVVSAPTGFGKSPVAYSLSQLTGMIERYQEPNEDLQRTAKRAVEADDEAGFGENGYYVTPQNILLDQLEEDYGDEPAFGMLKGRRHYSCEHGEPGDTCADGPCRYDDEKACTGYEKAKKEMLTSSVANTNFTMFMIHPQIDRRPGLVVDEAHMMPEFVLSKVSVELREDQLAEWDWSMPEFSTYQQYIDWFRPKIQEMDMWLDKAKRQLQQASARDEWGPKQKRVASKVDRTERLKRKMANLVRDWANHQEAWVVQHEQFYHEVREERLEKATFRPVTPYRFMDDLVFDQAGKTVISSATPPQSELLGVDEDQVTTNTVESEFPIENRPIYYEPVGKMSSANRDDNAPKAARKIQNLAYGNTLVHCHTYDFAETLETELVRAGVDRANIVRQRRDEGKDREAYIEEWTESEAQYFLSVNLYDGLDLKGDLARTNIMMVVPFPYLGDPQVQKRKEVEGDRFFNWQTAMRIQQAYGRSTRSKEDWSNFYVLDSNFGWFYKQNEDLFFKWFSEAVEDL